MVEAYTINGAYVGCGALLIDGLILVVGAASINGYAVDLWYIFTINIIYYISSFSFCY